MLFLLIIFITSADNNVYIVSIVSKTSYGRLQFIFAQETYYIWVLELPWSTIHTEERALVGLRFMKLEILLVHKLSKRLCLTRLKEIPLSDLLLRQARLGLMLFTYRKHEDT